ncbi:MAG TPA: DUF2158 domain-containing protein [Rubricoccaceae bacterium]|nr:DUF2158 domain-containing protein [Rubricoccaceae bacterium]
MPTFETGEAVRLKAGGPPMLVVEDQSDDDPPLVYCQWYTALGQRQECFPPDELEPTDERPLTPEEASGSSTW